MRQLPLTQEQAAQWGQQVQKQVLDLVARRQWPQESVVQLLELDSSVLDALLGIFDSEIAAATRALVQTTDEYQLHQGRIQSLARLRGLLQAEWSTLHDTRRRTE